MNTERTVRKTTCQILEMVDEGLLDAKTVLQAALMYMSEYDVADMAHANELIVEDEDEEPDDIDDRTTEDDA
jgi:hypothetical protein